MEAQMRARPRHAAAGTLLALATSLLLAAPPAARAAGAQTLEGAPPASQEAPAMCPAQSQRQAERQIFGVRQQLAAQLPPPPADGSFQVLNTRGANYASGQNVADPALFHFERDRAR